MSNAAAALIAAAEELEKQAKELRNRAAHLEMLEPIKAPVEGYFDADSVERTEDCDHGPCTGYTFPALNLTFYTYDNAPNMVSFHPADTHNGE